MKIIRIINGNKPVYIHKCGYNAAGAYQCFVTADKSKAGPFADSITSQCIRDIKKHFPGAVSIVTEKAENTGKYIIKGDSNGFIGYWMGEKLGTYKQAKKYNKITAQKTLKELDAGYPRIEWSLETVLKTEKKPAIKKRASRIRSKSKPRAKRAKNPVPASKLVRAKELYKNFTGHAPDSIDKVKIPVINEAIAIGEVDGILYSTVRDNELEHYIHKFRKKSRPTLAISGDGKNALILGGKFEFTDRGFVDK